MSGLDLSTPDSTRAFLRICLNGRIKRTPAKLAQILDMREWLREPTHQHAPHLAPLHAEAERLRLAANRAQAAYVRAMAEWVGEDPDQSGGE